MDATKAKWGAAEALQLVRGARRVVAAKGSKVVTFELAEHPSDEELLEVLLGPTGNLRAPTLTIGSTVFVGFNEEALGEVLQRR